MMKYFTEKKCLLLPRSKMMREEPIPVVFWVENYSYIFRADEWVNLVYNGHRYPGHVAYIRRFVDTRNNAITSEYTVSLQSKRKL